jgi:DNA-binding CsgD family transcriptional regulator
VKASQRQLEILHLAASGLTDKEIAQSLCISYRTVRTHLERLTSVNQVRGRTAIVAHWLASSPLSSSAAVHLEGGP